MEHDTHAALELTDANFPQEVSEFSGLVLVDFWAAWCTPCLMMAPFVEELAKKYADNDMVKIAKLDVDTHQMTAQSFQILSIPTFKVFVNGEIVAEQNGASSIAELEKLITNNMPATAKAA